MTHSQHLGGTIFDIISIAIYIEMAEGTQVRVRDLIESSRRSDEVKAILEADLIGSFQRTRSHGIRWKGFSPEGALDGVDLSTPSKNAQRHPEVYQDKFKRVVVMVEAEEDEGSAGDQENRLRDVFFINNRGFYNEEPIAQERKNKRRADCSGATNPTLLILAGLIIGIVATIGAASGEFLVAAAPALGRSLFFLVIIIVLAVRPSTEALRRRIPGGGESSSSSSFFAMLSSSSSSPRRRRWSSPGEWRRSSCALALRFPFDEERGSSPPSVERAVIDCNKGKVTFNVDDREHTVYFPKIEKACGVNTISNKMKKFKFGELFKKGTTSTGRPSRAATRIRQSYNEDILAPSFAPEEDNGPPNASTFPCYDFLRNAGILDDFLTLVNRAGIYGNPVTMQLKDFCLALDIDPAGTASRIDDNPRDLLELYRGITNDDCRTIQRGKIRNIQLPAIKYFAYYIATSILGRENTSNISSYHLAFLNIALTSQTSYHLGALIARRLSTRGPIFGGTIALRVLTYLDLPIDPNDVPLAPRRLDIAAMKSHHFVTTESTLDNMTYRMLFADGDEKEIPLPQPGLFDIDRQPWSRTKEEVEEHMKIQEFHQQHDSEDVGTSYDHTVTYPGASSSTYPEYDPSSYYGDTTSWDRWD
ncbi:hypothetical protein QYE76_025285 [Lolium multiflorum]|uniref:Arabidopsis retrotransposon Orf1 C-terminal domain-containing protein n=1 Tax=Lolium multiflorum TaxID=4521 RepID=A0AAD8RIB0_LOLMU|nr:hypothetical protein QYE76_025285 [Lolium multiflorum]